MPSRIDWSLAGDDVEWTSVRSEPDATPRGWHQEQGDGSVVLKCTARGTYQNRLVAQNTFHYELPTRRCGNDDKFIERLRKEASADGVRIDVRLFWAQHASDHYLGEWAIHSILCTPVRTFLVLRRLAVQSDAITQGYKIGTKRTRSQSEAQHLDEIRNWLPGWRIAHEPETSVHLDTQVVVNGRMQHFSGDSYTHDYVVASPMGCKRLCIESKANDDGLTEEAKQKCRALRDSSLCRVVAIVGHRSELHWYDFGPPGLNDAERTFQNHQQDELNDALGIHFSDGIR